MGLHHQHNQFILVNNGVTVTSLSANLIHKINADMDCLCQIALN